MIFTSAHLGSVSITENALDEFKILSCLQTNTSKSEGTMAQILSFLKFVEGQLPLRYLGLHLISRKLSSSDCTPLNSWCDRKLSFAGRLQLIRSVLYGIQVYWTNIIIIPVKVTKEIERCFNRFLSTGADSMVSRGRHSCTGCGLLF